MFVVKITSLNYVNKFLLSYILNSTPNSPFHFRALAAKLCIKSISHHSCGHFWIMSLIFGSTPKGF